MITDINFKTGETVRVFEQIKEGDKTRTQVYEGTVLGIRGRGDNKSFIVRKIVQHIGVEKIFPLNSPNIKKVEVKERPKKRTRRAKLYYLRGRVQ